MRTYNDYPKAATENAKRALKWAEKNGWGSCGTAVGKRRAQQLANREPLSRETIARMAAFERHRKNSKTPYGEGCGKLMWDAWGGDEGIEWAQTKLKQIDAEKYYAQFKFDILKETKIEFFTPEIIEKILRQFEIDKIYSMNEREFNNYFSYSAPIVQLNNQTYNVFVEGIGDVELKTSQYYPFSAETTNRLLRKNIIDFSQAKTYYVTNKLIDIAQDLSLDEFRIKAYSLMDRYYNEFGNVELDVMVRKVESAKQMADWWSDDKIDLLQFRTRQDDRVRPSHSELEGITRPKTDKFWLKYTPPLEYNCRCILRPVKEGLTTKPLAKDLLITESQVHKEIRLSTIHLLQENSIRSLIDNQHPYFVEFDRYKL